jgi:hypothetical protein
MSWLVKGLAALRFCFIDYANKVTSFFWNGIQFWTQTSECDTVEMNVLSLIALMTLNINYNIWRANHSSVLSAGSMLHMSLPYGPCEMVKSGLQIRFLYSDFASETQSHFWAVLLYPYNILHPSGWVHLNASLPFTLVYINKPRSTHCAVLSPFRYASSANNRKHTLSMMRLTLYRRGNRLPNSCEVIALRSSYCV